jgi:hypothetical protein
VAPAVAAREPPVAQHEADAGKAKEERADDRQWFETHEVNEGFFRRFDVLQRWRRNHNRAFWQAGNDRQSLKGA